MELPVKTSRSQELASPQSLPPTPKRRSRHWKQQSSRVPAPAPAQLQGLRRGPLLPLEEEPSLEAAVQQDRRVPASSRPAADAPSFKASKEQSWEDRVWEEIAHLPHGGAEGAAGNTAVWLPHVPKHSSISLQALAPAGQVNSRTQDRGASRGRSTTADRATPAAEAAQTAREYKPPAEKPKPLRTGMEAATYPCYIEILQKARLRPERPPGVPPRRRPVQPTAARPAAAAATQKTDKAGGKGAQPKASPQPAQSARYAALAASRQVLEPKRGQGRPLLRTEQRSAEKVLGAAPANSRAGHTNTSASVLADAGKRHEPKDPAQLRRGAGLENMPPAGERQAGAGYAQLLRANAGAGAAGKTAAAQLPARRVPRPAFRPSGSNGWRFGQPTVTVGEDLGYGTAHARAMAAHDRARRESEEKVAAARAAAEQAERLTSKAHRAVEQQAQIAAAERARARLLLSSDYTLQERLEWASNPDDTRSLHSKLLASSIGRWPADSLRSSWGHPLVGASGKAARSSGAARHLFPGTAAAAEPAGRKRNRALECSPAEQQVYDMSAIRAGRPESVLDGLRESNGRGCERSIDMAGTPRSHVSDTVLTGSGPLCDLTAAPGVHTIPAGQRAEAGDDVEQDDCPDTVTKTLARAEAQQPQRGSGLHCNPEVHSLLEKEAVRCIFIQDNPTFDSLRSSLGLPPSQLTSASQTAEQCQLALKDHNGEAKQRAAYQMLGRLEVPADAAAATDAERQSKPSGAEQPALGGRAADAGGEVYILAAADAVEGALNSHQAAKQDAAEAQMQGARSQSVFNSSLGFLGKDYAPLENSLSAHGPSPDTGIDTCEVESRRADDVTLSLDWRPANAPLTRVCEAEWSPAAAAFQGQNSTVDVSQAGSAATQGSITEGATNTVAPKKWSWLTRWGCFAPAVQP
ncbi:hypothetical protein COCSUDRAFT_61991 [Coccomyxa subellipsoidea C-169]|uniref:Uncharacterized protein n=1 Tax=Coccomyxa subellipsoidea (strain C-169) TaxID=574566 RepID=I0Z1P2_COCSC|nr:hypothetical protein COCSUDRAFT_61991 [Coccomyxa subellipsoidea C-169]EIE24561.1 hypothetical protein COCSUDRAFT_61991 [Coccomyxa subellipsoidea C-169]|eukprot:XP_005649105.1 hypothetical protein COCSUDRAFT_61991 [Coccomyxa subellipsoidea C-169]